MRKFPDVYTATRQTLSSCIRQYTEVCDSVHSMTQSYLCVIIHQHTELAAWGIQHYAESEFWLYSITRILDSDYAVLCGI